MIRLRRFTRSTMVLLTLVLFAGCGSGAAQPSPTATTAAELPPTTVAEAPTTAATLVPTIVVETEEPTTVVETEEPTTVVETEEPTTVVETEEPTAPARAPEATAAPTTPAKPTSVPTKQALPTAAPTSEAKPVAGDTQPTEEPVVERDVLNTGKSAPSPALARGSLTRRPYVVMIDNHPNAYPQSGLDRAALVFEGLAEYGITRFMAVYADGIAEAATIGPVRSSRIYFVHWALPFHPVYTHAGGSPDALDFLARTNQLLNLEELNYENVYSWRSKQRAAPHNMYTSTAMMRAFRAKQEKQALSVPNAGFLFRDPVANSKPKVSRLSYYFVNKGLPVSWTYDASINGYRRTQWGRTHIDAASGKQVWTRNVVVMQVPEVRRAGDDKGRIDQAVIGSGPARLFSEGSVQNITWSKSSATGQLLFYDQSGREIVFSSGQVWLAAVPALNRLSY